QDVREVKDFSVGVGAGASPAAAAAVCRSWHQDRCNQFLETWIILDWPAGYPRGTLNRARRCRRCGRTHA
ncbi:hypothetical protein HPB47_028500, partial [Ixodes persulcatus]